jgi:hypothetical protein
VKQRTRAFLPGAVVSVMPLRDVQADLPTIGVGRGDCRVAELLQLGESERPWYRESVPGTAPVSWCLGDAWLDVAMVNSLRHGATPGVRGERLPSPAHITIYINYFR